MCVNIRGNGIMTDTSNVNLSSNLIMNKFFHDSIVRVL